MWAAFAGGAAGRAAGEPAGLGASSDPQELSRISNPKASPEQYFSDLEVILSSDKCTPELLEIEDLNGHTFLSLNCTLLEYVLDLSKMKYKVAGTSNVRVMRLNSKMMIFYK